jgi:CRISPR-associated protein Cmr4
MSSNQQPYEVLRYFALALDPIHVGTGGYRLGRVDMSIVREPGTNLPKVPGTSIAGACRTYAAMQVEGAFPHCAGQGQARGSYKGHCGQPDCPVCVTFGFAKGESGSFQGLAQFSDARLVLFPVHSLAGPVWVTCPSTLNGLDITESVPDDGTARVAAGVKTQGRLNLGWLMLNARNNFSPDKRLSGIAEEILNRAVLVSDKLFSHIANDNLEVRTSVSIDAATGAAAEGALFTYEALPRGTVLAFEVIVSDPRYYRIQDKEPLQKNSQKALGVVENGLRYFEALGVGGMGSRGMGRLRVLGLQQTGGSQ